MFHAVVLHSPKCEISPPPILEVAQLRHYGIGIDAPEYCLYIASDRMVVH